VTGEEQKIGFVNRRVVVEAHAHIAVAGMHDYLIGGVLLEVRQE
jgi:hypothetical protein